MIFLWTIWKSTKLDRPVIGRYIDGMIMTTIKCKAHQHFTEHKNKPEAKAFHKTHFTENKHPTPAASFKQSEDHPQCLIRRKHPEWTWEEVKQKAEGRAENWDAVLVRPAKVSSRFFAGVCSSGLNLCQAPKEGHHKLITNLSYGSIFCSILFVL